MYRGNNWEEQRLKALERDSFLCQRCGIKCDSVHHIVPWTISHDNSLGNLITLCNKHHKSEDNHYVQFKQVSMGIRKIMQDRGIV